MLKKIKKIPLKTIILLVIVAIIILPVWWFLDSIHYQVGDYFFGGILVDRLHDFENFGKNKGNFKPLIREIDRFVAEHPNFFEEYLREGCDWAEISISPDERSLVFFERGLPYPDNQVFQPFSEEDWEVVKDVYLAFPNGSSMAEIRLYPNYPDYIMFQAGEIVVSSRFLIYTRGGRPNRLIDSLWERYTFVRVKRLARGWYDISPE